MSLSSVGLLLSRSEQNFIELGIEEDLRSDGRKKFDFRPFNITTNQIPQAIGSARLKLGLHESTDILVAIKADIAQPEFGSPFKGFLTCSIDRLVLIYVIPIEVFFLINFVFTVLVIPLRKVMKNVFKSVIKNYRRLYKIFSIQLLI
jgi:hypothetical protein